MFEFGLAKVDVGDGSGDGNGGGGGGGHTSGVEAWIIVGVATADTSQGGRSPTVVEADASVVRTSVGGAVVSCSHSVIPKNPRPKPVARSR